MRKIQMGGRARVTTEQRCVGSRVGWLLELEFRR